MQESAANNSQITYHTKDNTEYIGAFRKLSFGDCAVITTVQTYIILEGVRKTTRRNLYISAIILALSILIIYFFSKSLSHPLKVLTAIVNEINNGNFNTELFSEIKKTKKDEIGVLANSTKHEREILNTFTKLTNKGVTQAIIKKEIDFEPHLKDITIFFSDIRGFTAISDGFNKRFGEKSAAEIISFLNDYMGRMVNCINITGGNVDKFEGDAIMACWGVLRDDDLSFENLPDGSDEKEKLAAAHEEHVQADALSAIRATVAMRYALMEYNKEAEAFTKAHEKEPLAKYKPHIRIGCGLNSGRATVGFMGSYDKMEFTSIGDAVNLASRTESSNKPCGTDVLITEDTYNLLKYDFIKSEFNNFTIKEENKKDEIIVEVIPVTFEVKGKGKQHFYGVVNMPQFDIESFFKAGDPNFVVDKDCAKSVGPNGPKTLEEVRKLLGIPTPDFGGVNLDAEENKVTAS
jgi:adenylate cyclase